MGGQGIEDYVGVQGGGDDGGTGTSAIDEAATGEAGAGAKSTRHKLPGVRLSLEEIQKLDPLERIEYYTKVNDEENERLATDKYGYTGRGDGAPTSTGEDWGDYAKSTITNYEPEIWQYKDIPNAPKSTYIPQYDNDYARRTMGNMNAGQIASLELALYQAGYLSNEPGSPNNRSSDLVRAFDGLITEADGGRNDWEDQLEHDMVEYQKFLADEEAKKLANETKAIKPGFVVPAYKKPDYATLAQHVKATVRDQLDRKPTESELSMLSGYLEQQYRDAWQSNEVDVQRDAWTRNGRAAETGQEQGAGTIQQTDPLARFDEQFMNRYEGELDHRQRVDQSQERTQNLFGSFDMLSRQI